MRVCTVGPPTPPPYVASVRPGSDQLIVADTLLQNAAALLVFHHPYVGIREAEHRLEQGVPAQRRAAVLADEAADPEAGPWTSQPPVWPRMLHQPQHALPELDVSLPQHVVADRQHTRIGRRHTSPRGR